MSCSWDSFCACEVDCEPVLVCVVVEYTKVTVNPSMSAPCVVVEMVIGCSPAHSFLDRPSPSVCRRNLLVSVADFCVGPKEDLEVDRHISMGDTVAD